MTRRHTVPIGVLNVAMHEPHSEGRYVELLQDLYGLGKAVRTRGASGALLGKLYSDVEGAFDHAVVGEFYSFLYLDPDEPWFNLERNEEAVNEELNEIQIPQHLKPHLARFLFVFLTDSHRMYIQLKSGQRTLSINAVAKVLKVLLADMRMDVYGAIEVTVVPAQDTVKNILGMAFLHTLQIELVHPNPDDNRDDERRLLEDLKRQKARRMKLELSSERHHPLEVDENVKVLAHVASTNGHVFGSGRDENDKRVEISTRDTPMIEMPIYDPRELSLIDFMLAQARRISRFLSA